MRCHSNKKKIYISSHIHLYLLKMTELKEYHPHVYKKFMEGSRYQKNWQIFTRPKMLGKLSLILWLGRAYMSRHLRGKGRILHLHQEHLLSSTMSQCKWIHNMFQRLRATAIRETNENPTSLFKYELCLVWHIISSKGRQQACPCRWNLGTCKTWEDCSSS